MHRELRATYIPHIEGSHQSDHILPIFWEFELGDF